MERWETRTGGGASRWSILPPSWGVRGCEGMGNPVLCKVSARGNCTANILHISLRSKLRAVGNDDRRCAATGFQGAASGPAQRARKVCGREVLANFVAAACSASVAAGCKDTSLLSGNW